MIRTKSLTGIAVLVVNALHVHSLIYIGSLEISIDGRGLNGRQKRFNKYRSIISSAPHSSLKIQASMMCSRANSTNSKCLGYYQLDNHYAILKQMI